MRPNIEHHDGPTRFLVASSRSGEPPYLVELEANGLTGRCTCKQFECRLAPDIALGYRGPKLRCKHIGIARDFFAIERELETDEQVDQVLREYAKTQRPDESKPSAPWPPPEPMD